MRSGAQTSGEVIWEAAGSSGVDKRLADLEKEMERISDKTRVAIKHRHSGSVRLYSPKKGRRGQVWKSSPISEVDIQKAPQSKNTHQGHRQKRVVLAFLRGASRREGAEPMTELGQSKRTCPKVSPSIPSFERIGASSR
jgi:hypothetical protein